MIEYIEMHLTDHCNLKCAGCSHFSNIANPYFKTTLEFSKEMEALSKFQIKTLRLMGGEPLLHPDVLKLCEIARTFHPFTEIVLVTNGILLSFLNEEAINTLNNNHIVVCRSDYGLRIDTDKWDRIRYKVVHPKGEMYNISLDLSGKQDISGAFRNCDLHINHWYFFKDYKLYPCCIMPNLPILLNYNDDIHIDYEDIGIDIRDHNEDEIKKYLNTPTNMCKYCNTKAREKSKVQWHQSNGDINEWIEQEI